MTGQRRRRHDRIDEGFRGWARFVIRHRGAVLALSLVSALALGLGLTRLEADFSNDSFLLRDDSTRRVYDEFRARFGREDVILVGLRPREIFDLEFLERLRALHERIEQNVPYVSEVTSLIDARSTRGEGDRLIVEELLEHWPEDESALAALREQVATNPVYLDFLVSEALDFTTLAVELDTYSSRLEATDALDFDDDGGGRTVEEEPAPYLTNQESEEAVRALERVVDEFRDETLTIHVVGGETIGHHIEGIAARDAALYMPVSIVMISALLLALFRKVSHAVLPIFVVVLSIASGFGAMGWLGLPFTTPTQVLITFLMAVGTCDAVHILAIFDQGLARGLSREQALVEAVGHSGFAVVLTSLTTAGGLVSFVVAEIRPVSDLGIVSPIGVLIALAFTSTLLIAALSLWPVPARGGDSARRSPTGHVRWVDSLLPRCGALAVSHPGWVLGVAAACVVAASFGAARVRISDDALDWLFEDDPMRIGIEETDRALHGLQSVEVLVDTKQENGLYDPAVMSALEAAEAYARSFRTPPVVVGSTLSLLDILRETHRALNENRPEFYTVPDDREVIAQELLLFENSGSDDLEKLTDSRFETARLSLRVGWADGRHFVPFLETFEPRLQALFGESVDVTVTGGFALSGRAASLLLGSLASSYVLALAIITPIMILLLGDLRRGLIAMAPNLIPVWLTLGVAGFADLPLNMSTMLVGSLIIGVVVDDTIHFMHQYDRYYARSGDSAESILETLRSTGSALFITSLVLTGSFLILLLGHFNGMVHFGILAAFATVVAFLADVLVGPALIHLTRPRAGSAIAAAMPRPRSKRD